MGFLKFLVFTFFSSIEYTAILVFTFTLFRIHFRSFKIQIVFVCVSLSYISFTMREDMLADITPFVQLAVLIIFMWLLFRIHLGYAAFISFIGYFAYGLLQGVLLLLFHFFVGEIVEFTFKGYQLAALTGAITFFISYVIKRKNWGYSFVPDTDESKLTSLLIKDKFLLMLFVLLLVLGVGIVYYTYYFTVERGSTISFLAASAVLAAETALLIYFANKKEKSETSDYD